MLYTYTFNGLMIRYNCKNRSETALLYNDRAVLENYHISSAFRVLREEECNILVNLSKEEFR